VTTALTLQPGCLHYPGYLDATAQQDLVEALRAVVAHAPLFTPCMPRSGKPFSVRMSNCGALGWVSDETGYRYQATHPATGNPWPAIPAQLLALWDRLAGYRHPPQACLINFYAPGARMGLHQDRDEQDFDAPVLSVSLGDTGVFRMGGETRGAATRSCKLQSGDVLVFGGPSRLAFHGIDRIQPGTSRLLAEGGRLNLTLRRVTQS
jgi:DNA oxidative demethylase